MTWKPSNLILFYTPLHCCGQIVRAHKGKDAEKTKKLLAEGKNNFDIYICVNKNAHAFLLCAPVGEDDLFKDMMQDDPLQIPEVLLCWRFELCYENQQLRTYKIRKVFSMFKDIKPSIKTTFYIGRYKDVSPRAFQFSALRAAPHRYNAILNDCVEFAKEFCISLLSYCTNWKQLEEEVNQRIQKASATGLSIERLSRKIESSGWFGNRALVGMDLSTLFTGRHQWVVIAVIVTVFLVYPIIVALLVALFIKWLW